MPMTGRQPSLVLAITLRADRSGGPRQLLSLASGFRSTQLLLACPDDDLTSTFTGLSAVTRVEEVPHRRFSFRALLRLRRVIAAEGVDLIHSHGKGAGAYSRLLAILTRTPCVHTFHGWHVQTYGAAKRRIYALYERLSMLLTVSAICVSQTELDEVAQALGSRAAARLRLVENGVAIPANTVTQGSFSEEVVLATVSRFDYQKNFEEALAVLCALRSRRPARLVVAGAPAGGRWEPVHELVDDHGLSGVVEFVGAVKDVDAHFGGASLYISTSRWEGLPLALLEAMAAGLPVVASNVTGNIDVLRQSLPGALYQPGLVDDAADKILAALAEWNNRSVAGRALVAERFSADRMVRETEMVYLESVTG